MFPLVLALLVACEGRTQRSQSKPIRDVASIGVVSFGSELHSTVEFKRPAELFDLMDVRGLGELSEEELRAAFRLHRVAGRDHEVRQWFKKLDTNGDGRLVKQEFARYIPSAADDSVKRTAPMVFLGGSCNPTTWRKTIAIPLLEKNNITYYNPQVDVWTPSLVGEEAKAKDGAELLLFVIDQNTLALSSMLEVAELISKGRPVVLVVQQLQEGTVLEEKDGVALPCATATGRVLQDANRARAYLEDIADRSHVKYYTNITQATMAVVEFFQQPAVGRSRVRSLKDRKHKSSVPNSVH